MDRRLTFKLIIDYGVYLLVRLLEEILNLIPVRAALAFGRFVGRLGLVLLPDRREAALENLTIAFGREQTPQWIRLMARKSFEHLGMAGVEFFLIRRWTQKEMAERLVIAGAENFNLLMMPGNHGICLLASHFGCFEVSAATMKFLGTKVNLIVTPLKNPFVSRYMFSRGGENSGIRIFPHRGVVKDMIAFGRQGQMVTFLADQRGDASRGIFVNYFGTPCAANEVFARIAIDGELRILPLGTYRGDDGRYYSRFEDEIVIELTGDRQKDLTIVSQQFHDQFERWIRIKPEQGYWVQRKWRRKSSRRRPS